MILLLEGEAGVFSGNFKESEKNASESVGGETERALGGGYQTGRGTGGEVCGLRAYERIEYPQI